MIVGQGEGFLNHRFFSHKIQLQDFAKESALRRVPLIESLVLVDLHFGFGEGVFQASSLERYNEI